ncbi:major capsid protein [Mycetocola saprophilus]|uniref:major capsid protein n=1 Tax=Mycetocola saprophilus TaxID=76636 RepID=UPI0004C0048D|nr:major capsid protein [Mycetocola saprophilus]
MALWTDVVDPVELTGYARQTLEDYEASKGSLARFLPNKTIDDIVARFQRGRGGLTEVAEYRAYDAETSVGDVEGGERVTLELPPLGRKLRNSEYDRIRARGNVTDESVRPTIEKYAGQVARAVSDRIEFERGRVIDTAKVDISENGFIAKADFERRADFSVTAANLWSAADADPLRDIETWRAAYVEENGEEPGTILTSTKVLNAALKSAAVRALVAGSGPAPTVITRETFNTILASFGLPAFEIFDRRVKRGGANVRVTPDDKVYLLPAATDPNDPEGTDLGASFWGTTAEASEPEYGIPVEERGGLVVGTYKSLDPVGVWVHGAAIGLPVLTNPNLSLAAKVL